MGDTLGHDGREAGKVLSIPSTREKGLAAESKKKATMMAAFIVLLVPSPLVEKRSDPYHGSVLPLNYEGGLPRARYKLKSASVIIGNGKLGFNNYFIFLSF